MCAQSSKDGVTYFPNVCSKFKGWRNLIVFIVFKVQGMTQSLPMGCFTIPTQDQRLTHVMSQLFQIPLSGT